jgi:putative ABC transport system permease protein
MTREFSDVMQMKDTATGLILTLLAIIAVVGISNTMLMAVLEREQEIGMMRALGVRDREISGMFAAEAAGIGVFGAGAGLILGTVLVWYLSVFGIDYGFLLDEIDIGYRFTGVLYGIWDPALMVRAAVFAVLLAGTVSLLPVRRILKRSVTDSLRRS